MADFCNQCAGDVGFHIGDLADLPMAKKDKYSVVLCEGCGLTIVDVDGTCVSAICLKKHDHLTATSDLIDHENNRTLIK